MRIALTLLLMVVLVIGGFALYHRNQIDNAGDFFSLVQQSFQSIVGESESDSQYGVNWAATDRIGIASFKLNPQSATEADGTQAAMLADICLDFDVIALQWAQPNNQQLADLIAAITSFRPTFRYIVDSRNDGYAILFDSETIELVGNHHYSINDPEQLFQHPPLVAWFQSRLAPPNEAFTFTLVNYQTDDGRAEQEFQYVDSLFRAVREDGRGEDDIILVGDLGLTSQSSGQSQPRLMRMISSQTTTVLQNAQLDNILYQESATVEYHLSGVVDFMSRYNLRLADALKVSDRNPVWSEFSIYEGQRPLPRENPDEPFRRRKTESSPGAIPVSRPNEPQPKSGDQAPIA